MRKFFIAGLIILLPVALTLMVIVFLVDIFTSPFLDVVTNFLVSFKALKPISDTPELVTLIARILILILLCVAIFILGVIARWFFFSTLIKWMNAIFSHTPILRSIYNVTKDIVNAFFSLKHERKAFLFGHSEPLPVSDPPGPGLSQVRPFGRRNGLSPVPGNPALVRCCH